MTKRARPSHRRDVATPPPTSALVNKVRVSEYPANIPTSAGVYQFSDENGTLIYVGKAKNLRARVSTYFGDPASMHPRTAAMVAAAARVTWLELPTELDALICEADLINTHQPHYNVRLKDDSTYPFVAVTTQFPPRAFVTRNRGLRGATLHGPYPKTPNLWLAVDELCAELGLAICRAETFASARRTNTPCLQYHLERCGGPCIGAVSDEEYGARVRRLEEVLEGSSESVREDLSAKMQQLADQRRYEAAARVRDTLAAVASLTEPTRVSGAPSLSCDVVALASARTSACVTWVQVREGRVVGYSTTQLRDLPVELLEPETTRADLLSLALRQIYTGVTDVPGLILVAERPRGENVSHYLRTRAGHNVIVSVPAKGPRAELVKSAQATSESNLAHLQLRRVVDIDTRSQALRELAAAIGHDRALMRIECYDMAHLQGTHYVGSMVVFEDGLAKKAHYRTFRLRDVPGNNDLAAMREVLRRRLARLQASRGSAAGARGGLDESFSRRPDLLVIDGGPAQLSAVLQVVTEMGFAREIPVVSLAKRLEEVYLPSHDRPVVFAAHSEALYLLQRLRDEAHRVANSTHARARAKSMTVSALDSVAGLGVVRRQRLLEEFGTWSGVLAAHLDELLALHWLPKTVARNVHATLRGPEAVDRGPTP
jgi:excinuclease ABC subunit C